MTNRAKEWPAIKRWLRTKCFYTGQTMTGWVAVNRTGIVVTVSHSRIKVEWPIPGEGINERKAREATMPWMHATISEAERDIEAIAREADENNREFRRTDGEGAAIRKAMYEGEG